jgi:hypothetical protein
MESLGPWPTEQACPIALMLAQPCPSRKGLATRVLVELLHHETRCYRNVNIYAIEGPTALISTRNGGCKCFGLSFPAGGPRRWAHLLYNVLKIWV